MADKPAPRYKLQDAAKAAAEIRKLRVEARDPDLDVSFPVEVRDDDDVDAVVEYAHRHRRVTPLVLGAELEFRSTLLEYQRQRDTDRHERRVLAMLEAGRQLGVRPAVYGAPMGLRSRQAVYHRRVTLAARTSVHISDEGRAQEWLDEHVVELRGLADLLIDHRDELLLLVDDGPAREKLANDIDNAGALMSTRRPTMDFCGAVAYAIFGLRPGAARPAADRAVREQLAQGLRLLW
ncbi:hypothetical protein [Asanoa siamensis]|uniref:Uncharacterized protein n=1 Tax=Asanoa siamensis TaxID=926357 RepID=A0ABQ4D4C2_9ACTN|nr:hypothetical protein [Asanoa siamensis]GIF78113.1 hypothetical protein Asi02nite_76310 [Asanoa siamensis]